MISKFQSRRKADAHPASRSGDAVRDGGDQLSRPQQSLRGRDPCGRRSADRHQAHGPAVLRLRLGLRRLSNSRRLAGGLHPPATFMALVCGLWSLATLLQGFAGTFVVLFSLRLLVGMFEAPSYPITNRLATTWFPDRERAGAIGVLHFRPVCRPRFSDAGARAGAKKSRLALSFHPHRRDRAGVGGDLVLALSRSF